MNNIFRYLGASVLCVATLCSCSGEAASTNDNHPNVAGLADSIAYSMGQTQAYRYWQQSTADSTLAGDAAKKKYFEGYEQALKVIRANDPAFNEGVLAGIQSAYGAERFTKSFGISLNRDEIKRGMKAGLVSSKSIDVVRLRGEMDMMQKKIEHLQIENNRMKADSRLKSLESKGFKKISEGFYYHEISAGEGELLKDKEIVKGNIGLKGLDGRVLMSTTAEGDVSVGSLSYSKAINEGLLMMRRGATYEFATPAVDFYGVGRPIPVQGVSEETPVIWTISIAK